MQNQMLFLFLVLLFGLLGCSFLGGSYRREGLTNPYPTNTSSPSSSSSSSSPSSSSTPPSNYNPLPPAVAASNNNYNHATDGIPASQIPKGSEDLYILKSQIAQQVSPAGSGMQGSGVQGSSLGSGGSSNFPSSTPAKCPPCPACERCEEPSYDCKLVPNYNAFNSKKMPVPVLSDFSTFGM